MNLVTLEAIVWYDKCRTMPSYSSPLLRDPMPNTPRSQPDPMAREVDRLLAQLERTAPVSRDTGPPRDGSASPRPIVTPRSVPAVSSSIRPDRGSLVALWARVLLGVGLGVLMTQWPYAHGCGLQLAGYLGAVATVMLAAAWGGFASWKLRKGLPHILSLILFFWGIVLAGEQVLPRIGYAANPATWGCSAEAATLSK